MRRVIPRKVKPNYPVEIDWSNPLSKGLTNAWFLFSASTSRIHNSVEKGIDGTITAGNPVIQREGGNLARVCDGSLDAIDGGQMPSRDINNDGFTWVARLNWTVGDLYPCLLGNRYDGTSSPLQFAKLTEAGFQY